MILLDSFLVLGNFFAEFFARLLALLTDDEDVQPLASFETPMDFVSETTQDFSQDVATEKLATGELDNNAE